MAGARTLGFDATRLGRIPAHVAAKYVEPGRLPHAATLVSRGGEIAHLSTIGDARPGQPLAEDTIYRIASMTKPVTAVALMMLVEEGRIALGDPVAKYLPEFGKTGVYVAGGGNMPFVTRPLRTPMRVIDLMRHTAGLTYGFQERSPVDAAYRRTWAGDFALMTSSDDYIAALSEIPLLFDPGAHWNYSVATDVVGVIVERISGQSLGAFFEERIFAPLGMADTAFSVPADKLYRLADAYSFDPATKMALYDAGQDSRWANAERFQSGGGGLVSTLSDYHAFCQMLLGGGKLGGTRILSRASIALMTANHLPGGGDLTRHSVGLFSEADSAGGGYGLGLGVTIDPAATLIPGNAGEFYWGGMFSTGFFVDPVEDLIILFMTQLMPSSTYAVRREVKTLVHAARDD
jgi:CubicO group peptidase (beta-lactamase class C family)